MAAMPIRQQPKASDGGVKMWKLTGPFLILAVVAGLCLIGQGCSPDAPLEGSSQTEKVPVPRKARIKTVTPRKVPARSSSGAVTQDSLRQDSPAGSRDQSSSDYSKIEESVNASAVKIVAAIDAGDEAAVQKCWESLSGVPRQAILDALRGLGQHGDVSERKNALYALAMAASQGGPMAAEASENAERKQQSEQWRHDIMSAVGEGLDDEETTVRNVAYEVMQSLDDDSKRDLGQQLMSGEDAALKVRLLSDISGSATDTDVGLSVMALGDASQSVREKAAANLKAVSGKEFSSQEEAQKWWGEASLRDKGSLKIQ